MFIVTASAKDGRITNAKIYNELDSDEWHTHIKMDSKSKF